MTYFFVGMLLAAMIISMEPFSCWLGDHLAVSRRIGRLVASGLWFYCWFGAALLYTVITRI